MEMKEVEEVEVEVEVVEVEEALEEVPEEVLEGDPEEEIMEEVGAVMVKIVVQDH